MPDIGALLPLVLDGSARHGALRGGGGPPWRVTALQTADDARARWFLDSIVTRDNAHRPASELRARDIDSDDTSDHVTADEWLATQRAEQADDERHRDIRPADLASERDELAVADGREHLVETDVHDDLDPQPPDPAAVRDRPTRHHVATADEAAEAVARAQAALRMIEARQAADAQRAAHEAARAAEAEARAAELAEWARDDEQAAEQAAVHQAGNDRPVLER